MIGPWLWPLLAAMVGGLSSWFFSSVLQLERGAFVGAHALVTGAFVAAYAVAHRSRVRSQLTHRWRVGILGGILLGLFLIRQVLAQPASPRGQGAALFLDLSWFGIVYGFVDAVLLSVVPVLSLYGMRSPSEMRRPAVRLRWAMTALLASALVAAVYHFGFTEYRGRELIHPVIGNVLITLAYLATGSPMAAVVSHVMMHGAAVVHGMETTVQLPPHYE